MSKKPIDVSEKIKQIALKSKMNVIDSIEFRSGSGDVSGILGNMKDLHKKNLDSKGLLEFYKTKGWRPFT